MLRTLLCVLGLVFSQLHAQPVFNRADMPVAGDSARVMNAAAPSNLTARLNVVGAQKRWDFSDLQPSQSELVYFRGATETPYFFFILANAYGTKVADSINLLLLSLQNVYDFYNTTNARFAAVGRGVTVQGFPLPAQYTDADEVYFLPLQFGRRDTSTFAYGLNIPGTGGYNSRGGRLTEVDAWGELVTPFGTYQTLRVKSTLRIIDSISFNGFNLALPLRTEIEYKWLTKGEKVPVLQIRGNSLFGLFTPTTVQYRYNLPRIVPPISVPVNPGEVVLYPNPTRELIFIAVSSLDRLEHIQVFDEQGRVLYDEPGSKSFIDVRDLRAGVYHMRLQGQYGIYHKKFVVAGR
ncbi:MAG: hypothetical protein C0424_09795 [Sphingobacteriaceae bacterium]|nr:hypothetical protein [Sphingobacteriaceae bacterium]